MIREKRGIGGRDPVRGDGVIAFFRIVFSA